MSISCLWKNLFWRLLRPLYFTSTYPICYQLNPPSIQVTVYINVFDCLVCLLYIWGTVEILWVSVLFSTVLMFKLIILLNSFSVRKAPLLYNWLTSILLQLSSLSPNLVSFNISLGEVDFLEGPCLLKIVEN